MKKQPIKLKVRRNPRTGSYVAPSTVDDHPTTVAVLRVDVSENREWGSAAIYNREEIASWPSVPWEEVPLRVRAQFRKMLREDNDV